MKRNEVGFLERAFMFEVFFSRRLRGVVYRVCIGNKGWLVGCRGWLGCEICAFFFLLRVEVCDIG